MESSRRDLFIDMVVGGFTGTFKKNQITLYPCFTVIPKTGVGLPKTEGLVFTEQSILSLMPLK